MPNDTEPHIYLTGGTDELWLEEEGRKFVPGDQMPRTLTAAKRASLQAAGIRFETRHPEPEAEPKLAAPSGQAEADHHPRRAASKE
jgi:hypothetical protein